MIETVLKIENVSKQYRLGEVGTGTLSHDFKRWWYKSRGKEDPYLKIGEENRKDIAGGDYVWALKDINFEVKQGEVLGIIGKNGAGKSTLLKLLSRVTAPTTGQIKAKGRIASLLEVGTGMHPDLTGRENVYLNGAILGMTKAEIASKFDEIVDFSGCGKYVDTPVKRYSSGMKVRLGFAVAAFLEPEILIIDEVLAVGDAEFQKKAIGKMQDVAKGGGRTVLFVSHNMAAVKSLCTRGIVLKNGVYGFEGTAEEAVHFYLNMENNGLSAYRNFKDDKEAKQSNFQLHSITVRAENKHFDDPIGREDPIVIETILNKMEEDKVNIVIRFKDNEGNIIFVCNNQNMPTRYGKYTYTLKVPNFFFNQGNFSIDIMLTDGIKALFLENDVASFIIDYESIGLGEWMGKTKGALKPNFDWEIEKA